MLRYRGGSSAAQAAARYGLPTEITEELLQELLAGQHVVQRLHKAGAPAGKGFQDELFFF